MTHKTLAHPTLEMPHTQETDLRTGRRGFRTTLRVKITLPFLILAIAMAAGGAYLVTQIVFETIEERYTNSLIESGKLVSEAMVRQEESLLANLREISWTKGVAESLIARDTQGLFELVTGAAANRRVPIVEFLDAQGQLLLSLRGEQVEDNFVYSTLDQTGINYVDLPFVQKVLAGQEDGRGNKFAGLARTPRGDILYVAGPVLDGRGEMAGIALIGKMLPDLLRSIHLETLAQVTAYDSTGGTIASTFYDPPTLEIEDAAGILRTQDAQSLRRNIASRRGINVSNLNYDEILGPWEVRGGEDLGVIGISLAHQFLVGASQATRLQVTALVSLALLLVLVLGVSIANVITRPLRSLMEASAQVAEGDLSVQVEPIGHDELAVLTQSFNQMVHSLSDSKTALLKAYDSTLVGWSNALELRDRETEGHTQRVTEMTLELARWMGISGAELDHIRRGALLHDIGKMGIPDSILLKPGELTREEWVIMRKHPVYAYEMLKSIEYLRPALDIPYCHHERWDGSGYPRGLKGEAIPFAARIFAVIDVWDAMRSHRPYRCALTIDEVCDYINSSIGTHFDPRVVDAFFEMLGRRPCQTNSLGE